MKKILTVTPPEKYAEDFVEGQEFEVVDRGAMMVGHQVRWAGACDNYHAEFHHDEYVAKAQGLPGIILSGPLFGSFLLTQAIVWFGSKARIRSFMNRNSRATMPRDTVRIHGRTKRVWQEDQTALVELECWITNQDGLITTPGSAVAELPFRNAAGGAV